ncbi:hypothetical protein GQ43DRAFT_444049, partial [Delitschia confertaspora ATCC 74209]
MGKQVTEIVNLPLHPGTDLQSGDSGKIWTDIAGTISSQDGCQGIYWGRQIEHPDIVQLAILWDDISSHEAFMKSPTYGPFGKTIMQLVDGNVDFHHAALPAHTPFAQDGNLPTTECLSLYFPKDYQTDKWDDNWNRFCKKLEDTAEGMNAVVGAWGIEEVNRKVDGKDTEARVFNCFIGWESVDAHIKFRDTEGF